ncbi:MAG: Methyltransferase domain [Rhodobacteraceae bacterium HLUCCA08]|nr:MAG: Methyltransferase domain [Rhodobacteraceae bacterium HLUCCA08]
MTRKAFFTLHRDLPREGPGDRADVAWAVALCDLPTGARICDAGCGPGADIPALLFRAPGSRVTGIDLHAPFVADATARFAREPRVEVTQGRLIAGADGLPDPVSLGPFDLIWCAGAIYFEGIAAALRQWRDALAPGGHVAFSEPVLLTDRPSDPVRAMWDVEYPQITDAQGIAAQVAAAGYETLATRVLPDSSWEGYYGPMERRIADLRPGADPELARVLDEGAEEARIWRQYRHEFGYLLSVVRPA